MEDKRSKRKSSRTDKRIPFDKREIIKIVGMIESGVPRREILCQYGMHHSTLTYWMNRHGSPSYRDERPRCYSPSERRSILRAVESGMSVRQACVAFGVKCRSTVDRWLRMEKSGRPRNNAELSPQTPVMQPKEEYGTDERKALERELAEAQLKIRALETMIDIAEEQLKIDIRKKSGAKQSPK
jgi:transposase